ncbi:adenylylsulfate reductase-associated electron transfer protein QmoA [Acidobacteriia bacterium SbA2]|nr:adenylylsulfate reductase-associated electron transfer protein QmoA [Acidobacteriia bacterium SbA2]
MTDTLEASRYGDGKPILVIGGGIAGLTTAIEAAEAGCQVILVEKAPYLGGRVARMHQYFPKLCPPTCGLEINFRRLRENPRVTLLTLAKVEEIKGGPGDYEVKILLAPRFVTQACTLCGECAQACPAERADEFNYGMSKTKAVYLPYATALPASYVIDRAACPEGCKACKEACVYGAIDLDQKAERKTFRVAAVVAATGWAPYDVTKVGNLGFGKYPNVVTNFIMERLAAVDGPTRGRILRPSDGKEPKTVAFVQCAGSRDENHLPYCSAVCCAASLKQASYICALYPQAAITIFYIDVRTPGRLEKFYASVAADEKIRVVKGKVAKVEEEAGTADLLVTAEDVLSGKKGTHKFDLVVLAAGIVPQTDGLPGGFEFDEFKFLSLPDGKAGLYGAGCARRPGEVSASVQDATGAALKALQCVARSMHNG